MNKFLSFFKNSYDEMVNHVTWSSYSELQESSILVLVASLIFAGVIWLVDMGFRTGIEAIYNSF